MKLGLVTLTEQFKRSIPSDDYLAFNIGAKLKKLRLSFELAQKDVARENGFSAGMLSLIENEKVCASITVLSKLAEFYGVKMSWLLEGNFINKKFNIIRKGDGSTNNRVILHNDACNSAGLYSEKLLTNKPVKMKPYLVQISNIYASNNASKNSESFVYVIKGDIEISAVHGTVILCEGDSVYLKGAYSMISRSFNNYKTVIIVVHMQHKAI